MASMTPEGKVKEKIKAILKKHGAWYCMPMGQAYGRAGIPDFIVCLNGKFIAIEAKSGNNTPTPRQNIEIESIRKAGGAAEVVRETSLTFLDTLLTYVKG